MENLFNSLEHLQFVTINFILMNLMFDLGGIL